MMTEEAMLELFGDRNRMAAFCLVSLHTLYNWPKDKDTGAYTSPHTRTTILAGLVRRELWARQQEGIPIPDDPWGFLADELKNLPPIGKLKRPPRRGRMRGLDIVAAQNKEDTDPVTTA